MGIYLTLPKRLNAEILQQDPSNDRFSAGTESSPESLIQLVDPETGKIWGFVVIDNSSLGPGLGGIRMVPDLSLWEVHRLAKTMTLKNAISCIPYGGGKSGLILDPFQFIGKPEKKAQLMSAFAQAIFPLDRYIPAPDMGTDEKDIQTIHEVFEELRDPQSLPRGVGSRPPEMGGIPIDQWGLTAHGLLAAAEALQQHQPKFSLKNSDIIIQGFGNVGAPAASKFAEKGARIVGVSDINCGLWNPEGLDIEELLSVRSLPNGLANYKGITEKLFVGRKLDWLLEAPCDLLIPAARPDAITSKNSERLQCRFILQGANTPSNKMTEYFLYHRRNILSLSDFVVNVGGVIGCAVELQMEKDPEYEQKVRAHNAKGYLEKLIFNTVSRNTLELLERLNGSTDDKIFRELAVELAEERLFNPGPEIWL